LLKRKFIKDTFFLETGTLVTAATYMITSILLARFLGPEEYGRYGLADRIYGFCFFLANLGLVNVTVVRFSQATGKKSREDQTLALAAFLKIYLIMVLLILVLGFFLCPLFGDVIYKDQQVGIYAWILCFMGAFELMRTLALATLLGVRWMGHVARFESSIAIFRVVIILFALFGNYGLQGVIYGMVLNALLSSIIGAWFFHLLRREDGPHQPPRFLDIIKAMPRAPLKHFFSLSLFIALNKNMLQLMFIFGTFYMSALSYRDNAMLRIAWVLMLGLTMVLGAVGKNLLPTLGFQMGNEGQQDLSGRGRQLFKMSMATGAIYATLTAGFVLFLPWVIRFLYGPKYIEAVPIVMILAASNLVVGFGVIIEPFYIYSGRITTAVRINAVLFLLMVPAGYVAKELFGVVGVACYLSVTQALVLVHLLYIYFYFRRIKTS
jgi:O-antigen/teichoic acid export membrane protein